VGGRRESTRSVDGLGLVLEEGSGGGALEKTSRRPGPVVSWDVGRWARVGQARRWVGLEKWMEIQWMVVAATEGEGRRREIRRWGGRRRVVGCGDGADDGGCGRRRWSACRRPTAGRVGSGEFFRPLGRRSCAGGGGGDGEADPREGKKKLDENVVLVSLF
jgi:hypothetical protein